MDRELAAWLHPDWLGGCSQRLSVQMEISKGVLQGSELRTGPVNIFIDSGTEGMLSKSVDYTKLVWLICLREEMPSREALIGSRSGPM